ncbi:MAG: CBS domain-containing protein [bacterium]
MTIQRVKDLMVPIDEYPFVSVDASLVDVVTALHESRARDVSDREPHRAVLIVDHQKRIVGKIGQLAFMKALEPRYSLMGNANALRNVGLGSEFLEWMADNVRFWHEDFSILCQRARFITAKEIMQPIEESIDIEASLSEAVHGFVLWQTLSLLVTSKGNIVGILRLSDLYNTVADAIRETQHETQ